jgi:transcriptional regulator with XRE-family HTH domain
MTDELQIGTRARAARMAQGMTQADVAAAIGISVEVYGRMERQTVLPSVPTLVKLAKALRVTPNDLLGATPKIESGPTSPELRRIHRLLESIDDKVLPSLGTVLKAMAKPSRRDLTTAAKKQRR